MALPTHSSTGFGRQASPRSRVFSALLSAAMLLLIVLAMLRLGLMSPPPGGTGSRLTAVQLSADSSPRKAVAKHQAAKASHPQPVTPQVVPTPVPKSVPLALIPLSRQEFAAADISHMARHESDSSGSSGDSKAAYGPGEGPGGARLYNAEWYREPSRAEMAGYMPAAGAAPGSWAMIACKTVEHFHVDSCLQLDESPPGSGLARGLRQAAWQFLIRPPRIDGKPMIGAWVRIRFDFTKGTVE